MQMKKIGIIAILLLVVLAACAPQEVKKEEAPAEIMEEKITVETPKVETTPVQTETGREPPKMPLPSERQDTTTTEVVVEQKTEMNPQLRDLLKRADEKLSSLQYLYGGTTTKNLFLDTYMVKGTKTKIKKYSEDYYVREGYYDTIYVDLAIACCEEPTRCKSHNVDNTGKKFEVDVNTLSIPKTPYQWVKEIPTSATVVGPQTMDERSVTYIKYSKDGSDYEMWIDDTYGVVHKVVVMTNGNEVIHKFNDMRFNGLKDTEFNAPCA